MAVSVYCYLPHWNCRSQEACCWGLVVAYITEAVVAIGPLSFRAVQWEEADGAKIATAIVAEA